MGINMDFGFEKLYVLCLKERDHQGRRYTNQKDRHLCGNLGVEAHLRRIQRDMESCDITAAVRTVYLVR